jgi:hypothetical protein
MTTSEELPKSKSQNYPCITNLEQYNVAFFNKQYDDFNELLKNSELIFYEANYKYTEDFDGKPDFIAKNLLKGFIKKMDGKNSDTKNRKKFMCCFRCHKHVNENGNISYTYPAYWIVNTKDSLATFIQEIIEDFDYIKTENIDEFVNKMKKIENDENLIGEEYFH